MKSKKKWLTGVLASMLVVSSVPLVPYAALAAVPPPTITAGYQLGDHAKIEWSSAMDSSDIRLTTGFESGDVVPNLNWSNSPRGLAGGQAVGNAPGGGQALWTPDTSDRQGNLFNYPETYGVRNIFNMPVPGVPSGSTLSVSFRAYKYGASGDADIKMYTRSGWARKGVPVYDEQGVQLYFTDGFDYRTAKIGDSFRVKRQDGQQVRLVDGGAYNLATATSDNYDYTYVAAQFRASTSTFEIYYVGDAKGLTPYNPNGESGGIKESFNANEPLLGLNEIANLLPFRKIEESNNWVQYSANVEVLDTDLYDYTNRGVYLTTVWGGSAQGIYMDDLTIGYAPKTQLLRGEQVVYEGYLTDFEDTTTVDSARPITQAWVSASVNPDKTLAISYPAAVDRGSTYTYKVRTVPTTGSPVESTPKDVTVTSGIAGYAIQVNTSPTATPSSMITTTDTSYTYTGEIPSGEYYVHVNSVDRNGHVSLVRTVKQSVGTITGTVNPNTTDWTSQPVELTARGTSSTSWVYGVQTPDGNVVDGSEASWTATTNGSYTFVFYGHDGSEESVTYEVANIDTDAPSLDFSQVPAYIPRGTNETDVPVSIPVLDTGGAGVTSVTVQTASRLEDVAGSAPLPMPVTDGFINLNLQIGYPYYYRYTVTDRAGNETTNTVGPFAVLPKPTVPSMYVESEGSDTTLNLRILSLPTAYPDQYTYEVENVTTGEVKTVAVDQAITSASFTGLEQATEYQFRVRLSNAQESSDWSPVLTARTRFSLMQGVKVETKDFDSSQVYLSFDPNPKATEGYTWWLVDEGVTAILDQGTVTESVYNPIPVPAPNTPYNLYVSPIYQGSADLRFDAHTFKTLPSEVGGFNAVTVSKDVVSLSWAGYPDVLGYWLSKNGQEWVPDIPFDAVLSVNDAGLTPATTYEYGVAAKNESGIGDVSVLSITTAPEAPTSVLTEGLTSTSGIVRWAASAGATSYRLVIDGVLPAITVTGTEYEVTGLQPGSLHTVEVIAANENAGGSIQGSFLTLPSDVQDAGTASSITTTGAVVTLPETPGADRYRVVVGDQTFESATPAVTLTGLPVGSTVAYEAFAGNASGYSAAASGSFDLLLGAPVGVEVTAVTSSTARVSWPAVAGATGYVLEDQEGVQRELPATPTVLDVEGLASGVVTGYQLAARNASGLSDFTLFTILTTPGMPLDDEGLPVTATAGNIGVHEATIYWKAVPGATRYKVMYGSEELGVTENLSFNVTALPSATEFTTMQVVPVNDAGAGEGLGVKSFVTKPSSAYTAVATKGASGIEITFEHGLSNEIFVIKKAGKEIYRGTDKVYVDKTGSLSAKTEYAVTTENKIGDQSEVRKVVYTPVAVPPTGNVDPIPVPVPSPPPVPTPTPKPVPEPTPEPVPTPVPSPSSFPDIENSFAKDSIQRLADAGLIKGYPDGTFGPDKPITRAEYVVLMVRALGAEDGSEIDLPFQDISEEAWYAPSLKVALDKGFAEGFSSKEFGPQLLIDREQASKMTVTALLGKQEGVPGLLSFTDTSKVSAWASEYVKAGVLMGVLEGYPDGSFKPKQHMTRAEAASLLVRIMDNEG